MLLSLNNVSFSFGARPMLDEVSWQLGENERIGIVGPNGAGKSTLLKLIHGEYSVESGTINKANDLTIGFFNQDLLSFSTQNSILWVGMTAYEKAMEAQQKIDELTHLLESDPENEALLMEYSEQLHEFEVAGGYEMEHKSSEVLEGLGFTTADLQRPFSELSGGWRMRVLLAKLMLQRPKLLMLDEPTNHLDLPSIEWLEKYLSSYPGSVIIVSHDRFFLDKMVTKIVELFSQKLISYSGNYEFYQTEKALRMEMLEREYENQQKYIKQQERFIERFRAQATKATQAQSALKKLNKLDRIELPDDTVPTMNLNFEMDVQPGKVILDLKHFSKAYNEQVIFNDASIEISRGDKIALVGANGKGKSTLLRIIDGMEQAGGKREGWYNVIPAFYAQHQLEALHLDNTLLEELMLCGSGRTELQLRQLLGSFLFTGDDVFKKIKVLSGGEKARVSLAKVIISKANFLLLDEPTNHLDIQSVEMLIEALKQYQGSFVVVSHDRYFVSRIANNFWEIENGHVKSYPGTYEEWLRKKEEQAALLLEKEKLAKANPTPKIKEKVEEKPPMSQNKQKELLRLQRELERAEEKLNKAESLKINLEQELATPDVYSDVQKFKHTEQQYQKALAEFKTAQNHFELIFEQLAELEA